MTTIYHGTPLTPRAALLSVCAGRAMCVSFYRPDDVKEVEASVETAAEHKRLKRRLQRHRSWPERFRREMERDGYGQPPPEYLWSRK